MSLHHQYINNESIYESSINEYEDIFENYIDAPPSLKEALFHTFKLSGVGNKANSLYVQIITKVNKHLQKNFPLSKNNIKI